MKKKLARFVNFLKINFRIIFPVFFTALFVFIGFFGKLDKELIIPGNITPVGSNVVFKNPSKLNLNTTSVGVIRKPNYYLYSIFSIFSSTDSLDLNPDDISVSNSDDYQRGRQTYFYSFEASLITAYREAKKIKPEINLDYKFQGIKVIARYDNKHFEIGDLITKINGTVLNIDNYRSFDYPNIKEQKLYNETQQKELKATSNKLYFRPAFKIYGKNSNPQFKLSFNSNVGGSSGGFMQTLYIYLALINDQNINGYLNSKKIAGTGTIQLDGNVGVIGGVVQKVYTVMKYRCDVFFLPLNNYNEHKERIDKITKKSKIKLITIKSFEEGINKLKELVNA